MTEMKKNNVEKINNESLERDRVSINTLDHIAVNQVSFQNNIPSDDKGFVRPLLLKLLKAIQPDIFSDSFDKPLIHSFVNEYYNLRVNVTHDELKYMHFPMQEKFETFVPALAERPNAIHFSVNPHEASKEKLPYMFRGIVETAARNNQDILELGRGICLRPENEIEEEVYLFLPPCQLKSKADRGNVFSMQNIELSLFNINRLVTHLDYDLENANTRTSGIAIVRTID